MSSGSTQIFPFLELPTEIREKIYIYLVSSGHPVNLSPAYPPFPGDEPLYPTFPSSLLLSCVQIYQELLAVYFTYNTFTLTIRKQNDTHGTFLSPTSSFRQNLLTIRSLRLIILRYGSKNYFGGTVVPVLEQCILNGKLRNLEVWVRGSTCFGPFGDADRGYQSGRGGMRGNASAEYDNWGLLRRLCRDPWLEKVELRAGWLDEKDGEVVQNDKPCKSVSLA